MTRGKQELVSSKKDYDVIIVGAGIAGLTLGALLARRSALRVLLLEKSGRVGGRIAVTDRDGFRLDWGIHAMLFGGKSAVAGAMRAAGMKPDVVPVGMKAWNDGKFYPLIGSDVLGSLGVFRRVDPGTMKGLLSLFPRWILLGPGVDDHRSVAAALKDLNVGEQLEKLFLSVCIGLLASTAMERASVGEIARFFLKAGKRGCALGYPSGGWASIIESLRDAIDNSENVNLLLNCKVEKILTRDGGAVGVFAEGREINGRCVVCAFPAQEIVKSDLIEPGDLPADYRNRLRSIRSTAGLCVDVAMEKIITSERDPIVTTDPPGLCWFVSNVSHAVAPPGRQLVNIFSPMTEEELRGKYPLQSAAERLLQFYDGIFPGLLKYEMWRRVMKTVVNGAELNVSQSLRDRPGLETPGVRNLYLAGDTVSVGGAGAEISAASAMKCYGILIRKERSL